MALNQMPQLPEFQLDLSQGDEDDDAEEEKNMMTILMKLKTAQSSMNQSRKRLIAVCNIFDIRMAELFSRVLYTEREASSWLKMPWQSIQMKSKNSPRNTAKDGMPSLGR